MANKTRMSLAEAANGDQQHFVYYGAVLLVVLT
jgi:hypothetical protein